MSGLFTHRVLEFKPGFHFIVEPVVSDDEESVSMAQDLENVLNKHWAKKAPSQLTVDEVRDSEEAELIYADAFTLLQDLDNPLAEALIVGSVTVIGDMCLVQCMLGDDDEDEDEDDSVEADDEDFE